MKLNKLLLLIFTLVIFITFITSTYEILFHEINIKTQKYIPLSFISFMVLGILFISMWEELGEIKININKLKL